MLAENCAYSVESAVLNHLLFASVQLLTLATILLSAFITLLPPLAAVHHPVNVYPVLVAVGIVPAVEFLIPVYAPVCPFLTYNGLIPLRVPPFASASNVIFALFIVKFILFVPV